MSIQELDQMSGKTSSKKGPFFPLDKARKNIKESILDDVEIIERDEKEVIKKARDIAEKIRKHSTHAKLQGKPKKLADIVIKIFEKIIEEAS